MNMVKKKKLRIQEALDLVGKEHRKEADAAAREHLSPGCGLGMSTQKREPAFLRVLASHVLQCWVWRLAEWDPENIPNLPSGSQLRFHTQSFTHPVDLTS